MSERRIPTLDEFLDELRHCRARGEVEADALWVRDGRGPTINPSVEARLLVASFGAHGHTFKLEHFCGHVVAASNALGDAFNRAADEEAKRAAQRLLGMAVELRLHLHVGEPNTTPAASPANTTNGGEAR